MDGKIELIIPTFFPYKIVSAINVAINRKRIKEEAGYRAMNYITSLGIGLRGSDDLIEPTFRMARQYGLSTLTALTWHWQKKKSLISIPGTRDFLMPSRISFLGLNGSAITRMRKDEGVISRLLEGGGQDDSSPALSYFLDHTSVGLSRLGFFFDWICRCSLSLSLHVRSYPDEFFRSKGF